MDWLVRPLVFAFGANRALDRTAFWTATLAMIALVGSILAFQQLRSIRRTSGADFTKRFADSFFTVETRLLLTLLMNSALEFEVRDICEGGKKVGEFPFFKIKRNVVSQLEGIIELNKTKAGYSAFEVDDLLLGHFDDMGWFVKCGLVDFRMADQMMGYYIAEVFDAPAIQHYLDYEKGAFPDFQAIAGRCKKELNTNWPGL